MNNTEEENTFQIGCICVCVCVVHLVKNIFVGILSQKNLLSKNDLANEADYKILYTIQFD